MRVSVIVSVEVGVSVLEGVGVTVSVERGVTVKVTVWLSAVRVWLGVAVRVDIMVMVDSPPGVLVLVTRVTGVCVTAGCTLPPNCRTSNPRQ